MMAHWIIAKHPNTDVTAVHPDRFQPYQSTPSYRGQRVVESLGKVYKCHYPNDSYETCRGAKQSPLYSQLSQQGAFFREVSGFESADWFAWPGQTAPSNSQVPLTWGRPVWFDNWASEHSAVRDRVGLMDMSFMSKFRVQGTDSGALLDLLSTAAVDADPETITYTQWLNPNGTIEADLTVTKLDHHDFLVVASDTAHRHVQAMLRRQAQGDVTITDVTGALAQINIQGPNSRALLQSVSCSDLSNEVCVSLLILTWLYRASHSEQRKRLT